MEERSTKETLEKRHDVVYVFEGGDLLVSYGCAQAAQEANEIVRVGVQVEGARLDALPHVRRVQHFLHLATSPPLLLGQQTLQHLHQNKNKHCTFINAYAQYMYILCTCTVKVA